MRSVGSKVCSFQGLSLRLPGQPVAPRRGQKTHRVDLVDTESEKENLHNHVCRFDAQKLTRITCAFVSCKCTVGLCQALNRTLEPVAR